MYYRQMYTVLKHVQLCRRAHVAIGSCTLRVCDSITLANVSWLIICTLYLWHIYFFSFEFFSF